MKGDAMGRNGGAVYSNERQTLIFSILEKIETFDPMIQTKPPIPTAAASSSSAPPPPWTELPEDLTPNILQRLDAKDMLMSAQKVCKTWWRFCKNPAVWRVIHLDRRDFDFAPDFECVFRGAVDRSQGRLLELKLSGFRGAALLHYAAQRSPMLRCLTLAEYDRTEICLYDKFVKQPSFAVLWTALQKTDLRHQDQMQLNTQAEYEKVGRDITEVIKKLPQLEELHLIKMPAFVLKDFKTIGISCPALKSFTYSDCKGDGLDFEEYGVAVGKTMPNLRHLRLCEHRMGSRGREAIRDGCPHLESLDTGSGGCSSSVALRRVGLRR